MSGPATVQCPECGARLKLKNRASLGKRRPCPKCEVKVAIVAQGDRFERALAEKLMMYALGRTLEAADRPTIDGLVKRMQANQHTLRSLVQSNVETEGFRTK